MGNYPIPSNFSVRVTIKLKSGESVCMVLGETWCLDELWLLWDAMYGRLEGNRRFSSRVDYIVAYVVELDRAVHCWTWGIPSGRPFYTGL